MDLSLIVDDFQPSKSSSVEPFRAPTPPRTLSLPSPEVSNEADIAPPETKIPCFNLVPPQPGVVSPQVWMSPENTPKIPIMGTISVYKVIKDRFSRGYTCRVCDKLFARKSGLLRHERIHLGMRPNLCEICGKRFSQKSALTSHIRIHTGEKPYACTNCGRHFSDSSSLARHRRIHLRN